MNDTDVGEKIGCGALGFLCGFMSFMMLLLVLGESPSDMKRAMADQEAKHLQDIANVEKQYMIKMVKAGAARWVVADDGTTTWSERKTTDEVRPERVNR